VIFFITYTEFRSRNPKVIKLYGRFDLALSGTTHNPDGCLTGGVFVMLFYLRTSAQIQFPPRVVRIPREVQELVPTAELKARKTAEAELLETDGSAIWTSSISLPRWQGWKNFRPFFRMPPSSWVPSVRTQHSHPPPPPRRPINWGEAEGWGSSIHVAPIEQTLNFDDPPL